MGVITQVLNNQEVLPLATKEGLVPSNEVLLNRARDSNDAQAVIALGIREQFRISDPGEGGGG